jgi:hypothetical protein
MSTHDPESSEDLRAFRYHISEIIDIRDRIASLVNDLDKNLKSDAVKVAAALTNLEVELFDHLAYHLRLIRVPLKRLSTTVYSRLPDLPGDQ